MCELIASTTTCYIGQIQPYLHDLGFALVGGGLLALLVGLVLMFINSDN